MAGIKVSNRVFHKVLFLLHTAIQSNSGKRKENNVKKELFANLDRISPLYLSDIILYYIYPRIFICENDSKEKFLLCEMSNRDNTDVWLSGKISEEEYESIARKEKSIQTVYRNMKNLFLILKKYGKDKDEFEIIYGDMKEWVDKLPDEPIYK